MKTSIIIPTLNEASGLSRCLEHAWATQPHEVIVVDGGSSDGTVEIAKRHACRVMWGQRGRATQQNLGAQRSTGDVLLFLHADNWLSRDGIRQIEDALVNPRVQAGAFRHRIAAEGFLYRVIERGNTIRARVLGMVYGDQGIFVRRSIFQSIGGFPDVRLMEDVLLVRKLSRQTRLVMLHGPLHVSARRWQQAGPIRQTARNWALTIAELSGIPPDDLAAYYPPHDAGAKKNGR